MPRRENLWEIVKKIKLLRLSGLSSEKIERVIPTDPHVRKLPDGNLIEYPGDKEIIDYAYSESFAHSKNPDFVRHAGAIFFGTNTKKNGSRGGEEK